MTTAGWIALSVLAIVIIALFIWGFLNYLRRLQVRMHCWMVQGRTVGIEGSVSNMFQQCCNFQWNCDCVNFLVGDKDTPGGKLMEAIRACFQNQDFRETVFDNIADCTTTTIHTMAPCAGPNPNRPLWLALQIEGCRGRVTMSCQDALWFWWQLRMQAEQCCWT